MENGPSLGVQAGLLSALRQTHDPQFKPLYVAHTRAALTAIEGGNSVLNSCLDALRDLGENLETENLRDGFPKLEENWRQARAYIMRTHPDLMFPVPFGRSFPKD